MKSESLIPSIIYMNYSLEDSLIVKDNKQQVYLNALNKEILQDKFKKARKTISIYIFLYHTRYYDRYRLNLTISFYCQLCEYM